MAPVDGQAARHPRRRRPGGLLLRRRAARGLRPRRLPRAQRVHDRACLRRRRAVPGPRRPADLPLGEQLLLEGGEAGHDHAENQAVAQPRAAGGPALRRPVPRQRRRHEAGAVRGDRRRRGAVAVRGDRARERLEAGRDGGRLRDRDRQHDPGLAARHEGRGCDPGPVRPRSRRPDGLLRDGGGRPGLLGRRARLRRLGHVLARPAAAGQPLAPHARGPAAGATATDRLPPPRPVGRERSVHAGVPEPSSSA